MLRRLALPILLVLLAAGAAWQAREADRAADRPPREAPSVPPPEARTPLFSVRRIPVFLQEPEADRRLVAALEDSTRDLPAGSCVAVAESGRARF